jgi:hypothetical protein
MTPEQRKQQIHDYTRQLLDAVNQPAIEKMKWITELRRRRRAVKSRGKNIK